MQHDKRTVSDDRQTTQQDTDSRQAEIAGDIPQAVGAAAQRLGLSLSPASELAVRKEIAGLSNAVYVTTKEGDEYGREPGQLVRRDDLIQNMVQRAASASPDPTQNSRAETAKERNRKALDEGKKPPTTPPATGGEPVTVETVTPKFKTQEDYEAWIES